MTAKVAVSIAAESTAASPAGGMTNVTLAEVRGGGADRRARAVLDDGC